MESNQVRKQTPEYAPPLQKPSNSLAYSDRDRAVTFAHYLENTFQPNDVVPDIQINKEDSIRPVTFKEILKVIFKLRAKKAPGFD